MIMALNPVHADTLRKKRHIDPDLAMRLGVHSESSAPGSAILFEYRLKGQVHNVKARRGKGNMPWAQSGKPLILWNVDSLVDPPAPDESLVITEGEFDALAVLQTGAYTRVVSVPNGAPGGANEEGGKRYGYLFDAQGNLLPDISKFETVILATDGDTPGQHLRDALATRIGDTKCVWIKWPDRIKDANEMLIEHGPVALANLLMAGRSMWEDAFCNILDIPEGPPEEVYTLGDPEWDKPIEHGGIRLPRRGFASMGGPAHAGKSFLARQLCWHIWRTYRVPFAISEFEEPARPVYLADLRRRAAGKRDFTLEEEGLADIELSKCAYIIRRHPGGLMPAEALLNTIDYGIRVAGARVVAIDPFNEVDLRTRENRDLRSDEVMAKFFSELKAMAERYNVLMIVLAHPTADAVRKAGSSHLWSPYDIEGGRHWAGKSDASFMVWRPHPNAPTFVHAAKLKRHDIHGKPNLYELHLDAETRRFHVAGSGYRLLDDIDDAMKNGTWDQGYTAKPSNSGPTYSSVKGG
jgi:twinkle protein